jgi:NTE family protein
MSEDGIRLALVLGGGNAVGAYSAGTFEAFVEKGLSPNHLAGSSAGAICAALIAGNAPDRRLSALRAFWERVAAPYVVPNWLERKWGRPRQIAEALQTRALGRPAIFRPRPSALLNPMELPGLYDMKPPQKTLLSLLDLHRLNEGEMQVSILAVDLETGEEVIFDNRKQPIRVEHILASCALLPNFPPIVMEGRLLVDGGLAVNAPVHLVLDPPRDGLVCFVADPFPLRSKPPLDLLDAQERQTDLIFSSQTRRALELQGRLWAMAATAGGESPKGEVWRVEYNGSDRETSLKDFDFRRSILDERWQAGLRDMRAALAIWGGAAPREIGLRLHGTTNSSAN